MTYGDRASGQDAFLLDNQKRSPNSLLSNSRGTTRRYRKGSLSMSSDCISDHYDVFAHQQPQVRAMSVYTDFTFCSLDAHSIWEI